MSFIKVKGTSKSVMWDWEWLATPYQDFSVFKNGEEKFSYDSTVLQEHYDLTNILEEKIVLTE